MATDEPDAVTTTSAEVCQGLQMCENQPLPHPLTLQPPIPHPTPACQQDWEEGGSALQPPKTPKRYLAQEYWGDVRGGTYVKEF